MGTSLVTGLPLARSMFQDQDVLQDYWQHMPSATRLHQNSLPDCKSVLASEADLRLQPIGEDKLPLPVFELSGEPKHRQKHSLL